MPPKVVTFGEIMLRLNPPGFERLRRARSFEATYAGAEANVAACLAGFGIETEFVTRLPENDLGEACLAQLRQYGVGVQHLLRGGDRMGVYFIEFGAAQRPSRVLYDRAGSSFATLQPGSVDWQAAFSGADWFHWTGITPAVSESTALVTREALEAAGRMGLAVSCDLNYRAKLWQWTRDPGGVMEPLLALSQVAIVNAEAVETFFGIRVGDNPDAGLAGELDRAGELAAALVGRIPSLQTIAVTLRKAVSSSHNTWSGALWQAGRLFAGPEYDILPIVDRVGAGDAFAAGLIYGLRLGYKPDHALKFALATACLKHTIPGDFCSLSLAEVEALMEGDAGGRIWR